MLSGRIIELLKRAEEVESALGQESVLADQKKFKALAIEHAYLTEIRQVVQQIQSVEQQIQDNKELLDATQDEEFVSVVKDDLSNLENLKTQLDAKLQNLLVPPDPRDSRNIILEIRAGTGGDEAALFVGDCVRMYKAYADSKGWKYELLSCTESEVGGFKEYVMGISGQNVFRFMQYEAGTHRVQRVPKTEAQGRIHTSAVTVAVLLEPDEDEKIVLDEKDLKIDTYRASGAGGQHVNTTDSAVRITHIPTGTVVYSQEERSQHKNKDKCLRMLQAKIVEEKQRKAHAEMASLRASQVGSGDRSERIRTYNFPQNRVTDHRIELTLYKLDKVMDGDLDDLSGPLVAHFHKEKLEQSPSNA
jgi:peptide chain release factor 1